MRWSFEKYGILFYLGGILSLNQPKEGIYQCIGQNPYGIAQASTALILPNNAKPKGKIQSLKIVCIILCEHDLKWALEDIWVERTVRSFWSSIELITSMKLDYRPDWVVSLQTGIFHELLFVRLYQTQNRQFDVR